MTPFTEYQLLTEKKTLHFVLPDINLNSANFVIFIKTNKHLAKINIQLLHGISCKLIEN